MSARWAEEINLFRDIAGEFSFGFSGDRANPICWERVSNALVNLAIENDGHHASFPSVALDEMIAEGEALTRDISFRLGRDLPAETLRLYEKLFSIYQTSMADTRSAITAARTSVVISEEVRFDDLVLDFEHPIPHRVINEIRARKIQHVGLGMPGAPETPQIVSLGNHPAQVVSGNENWPPHSSPERIWDLVLRMPWIRAYEMLGLGTLDIRYSVTLLNPSTVFCVENAQVRGVHSAVYFVYLVDKRGGRKLIARSSPISVPQATVYDGPYRRACTAEQPSMGAYVKAQAFVDLLPYEFQPLFEKQAAPEALQSHQRVLKERVVALAIRGRAAILERMENATSDVSDAMRRVEASALLIRGISELAFPRSARNDPKFTYLLFGQPAKAARGVEFPLATAGLLRAIAEKEEPDNVSIFIDFDAINHDHQRRLNDAVGMALDAARAEPQLLPLVDTQLGRLQMLRGLKAAVR